MYRLSRSIPGLFSWRIRMISKDKHPHGGGSDPSDNAQIEVQRKGNLIQVIALIVTSALSVISLVKGVGALHKAEHAEQAVRLSRVEMGKLQVNVFGETPDNSWRPWILRISDVTTYVGVQRRVP